MNGEQPPQEKVTPPASFIWLGRKIIHPNQISVITISSSGDSASVHMAGGNEPVHIEGAQFVSFITQLKVICPPIPEALPFIQELKL